MDERGQELNELRDYGNKLLEEMRYPNLIGMLQETLTHLHDIACEYSRDADLWHRKYNACAEEKQALQEELQHRIGAWEEQKGEWRSVIKVQTDKIQDMDRDFQYKLDELRVYRDNEIGNYNDKVQSLLIAQSALGKMKNELEEEKRRLEDARRKCDEAKAEHEKAKEEYEGKRRECEQQIERNRDKIEGYGELFAEKTNVQSKIKKVEKEAAEKAEAANKEIAEWNRRYDAEHDLRKKIEKELEELKKKLQGNEDSNNDETNGFQGDEMRREAYAPTAFDDDDDDETK